MNASPGFPPHAVGDRVDAFAQSPRPVFDHLSYRSDVDGLRAIAVLSVVAFHAAPGRMPGGFAGVDMFFVISGFLIASIIQKGLVSGHFSFLEFYSRRIKRIFPALLLTLAACLAVGYFLLSDEELIALSKHVLAGAGFASNFVLWRESGYFDPSAEMKPLLHLWSLGIEEQFYLVWPFALWMAWKRKFDLLTLTVAVGLFSFALNLYQVGLYPVASFYLPFSRFWELLVGGGLAALNLRAPPRASSRHYARTSISFLGLAMIAVGFVILDKSRSFPGAWAILPTLGTAFVIWAGAQAWPNRVLLSNKVLVWFGLISFPLYLWHWPALSFLRILEGTEVAQWKRAVAVVGAIILSWLTYEFVEKAIRHRPGRRVPMALLALMVIVGLAGAYGYAGNGATDRIGGPQVVNQGAVGHTPFFAYIREHSFPCTPAAIREQAVSWEGFVRCFQSKQGDGKDIVLLGDSHAEHLFPGLASALPENNVVFYGMGGLPVLDNPEYSLVFKTLLDDDRMKTVIVAASWAAKLPPDSKQASVEALHRTLLVLAEDGKQVYVVEDVPGFSFIPNRCRYTGRLGVSNLCVEPDRKANAGYVPSLVEITRDNPRIVLVKLYDLFCSDGVCRMAEGGILHYRDDNHLSVPGSKMAARVIVSQMVPAQ